MKNLLKQAVLNREQNIVREIFVEDEDFFVDTCDCNSDEFNEMVDGILDEAGNLIKDKVFVDECDYIDDNAEILGFVVGILTQLGIDADEIDNYTCETLLEDSFLDIEDEDEDNYCISVNDDKLMAFYTTYLEV